MKKLALALVCLVSIAFFTSCDPTIENPEPAIAAITETGFLQNGGIIEIDQPFVYGFTMTSNVETEKELAKLTIVTTIIDPEGNEEVWEPEVITLSGKEYRYVDTTAFELREIIGTVKFTATVTDVDNEIATAEITASINYEEYLDERDITWIRTAANVDQETTVEMAELGLKWTGSYKEIMATLERLDENTTMYLIENALEQFNSIETAVDLDNCISQLNENSRPIEKYRKISAEVGKEYNDVLAIIDKDGNQHLILIEKTDVDNLGLQGTRITIHGKVK